MAGFALWTATVSIETGIAAFVELFRLDSGCEPLHVSQPPFLPRSYTSTMEFEWDPEKAALNLDKHGVEFAEATTIFADPLELTIADPVHSHEESRFLSVGKSLAMHVLLVSYTERENRIRIISARLATPRERRQYESTG